MEKRKVPASGPEREAPPFHSASPSTELDFALKLFQSALEPFPPLWHLMLAWEKSPWNCMTYQTDRSLKSPHTKFTAFLLAICFGVMSVVGAPLHEHDLDPFHPDPDCIPCHVAQTSISLEVESPELPFALQITRSILNTATKWVIQAIQTPSSRSPPPLH